MDPDRLKGLAHPLRVASFDALSMYGPQTATSLTHRVGESSASTGYHLRQLARHDFLRVAEGKSKGREKWWDRLTGGVSIHPSPGDDGDTSSAAAQFVLREWTRGTRQALDNFTASMSDTSTVTKEWPNVSQISTSNLRLTRDQLIEINAEYRAVMQVLVNKYCGRADPGSRPV